MRSKVKPEKKKENQKFKSKDFERNKEFIILRIRAENQKIKKRKENFLLSIFRRRGEKMTNRENLPTLSLGTPIPLDKKCVSLCHV